MVEGGGGEMQWLVSLLEASAASRNESAVATRVSVGLCLPTSASHGVCTRTNLPKETLVGTFLQG